jgi:hypothetical protein
MEIANSDEARDIVRHVTLPAKTPPEAAPDPSPGSGMTSAVDGGDLENGDAQRDEGGHGK